MGLTSTDTWRALARDPGQKPGYVVLDIAGKVLEASHKEEVWFRAPFMFDLVITEGQWWFYDPKNYKDPNRLFELAFEAGWGARGIPANRYLKLAPKVWRGGTNVDKAQMQRRIAKSLTAEERRAFAGIPKTRHGDVLDAIGIGRRGIQIALEYPEADSPHEWPPVKTRTTRTRRTKK